MEHTRQVHKQIMYPQIIKDRHALMHMLMTAHLHGPCFLRDIVMDLVTSLKLERPIYNMSYEEHLNIINILLPAVLGFGDCDLECYEESEDYGRPDKRNNSLNVEAAEFKPLNHMLPQWLINEVIGV